MNNTSEIIKGKRILAIDYGLKRTGIAVCDELHISITPLKVLKTDSTTFWDDLLAIIEKEKVSAIVVGIPKREDDKKTDVLTAIDEFIGKLQDLTDVRIFTFDESYSTRRAVQTMISIGKKKKDRSRKGTSDLVAAAVILRDFLSEME
ncbi:Holliday junction resolvase RuvX [Bacteroidetes/Chlorobi group bacterium ChocPot_Mid]|jgi:putative Holliday junction resolvase|nr:MAG: Holliday junction resolvase RuvX [Bacteroidetes/Chlorobi group bacterium ChocPot_Mid]